MESSNPRTIGKYEVLSTIGEGGMGIVYKARDPIIDRKVAIKTIKLEEDGTTSDELIARLRMEAKAAGRLNHPNIVTVFDFGQQDDVSFLVMEYVEGANLARLIAKQTPMSLEHKLDIAIQLCEAVAYAHGLGVIHRDIKPSNICVTRGGEPKILDFGLARFDETRLTRTGLTSGTLLYMSPERMSGESGPSDDIFALGAVIYELITGTHAFPGEKYSEIVNSILSGKYPLPPSTVIDVPSDLDRVIAQACARDKANRFASGADFAKALREIRYSQTFLRRVEATATPFATVAMPLFTDNPYTAGSLGGPLQQDATVRDYDVHQTTPSTPTPRLEIHKTEVAARPAPEQAAPTEMFSAVHYAKTETIASPAAQPAAPPAAQPQAHPQAQPAAAPKTGQIETSFLTRTRTAVARAVAGLSGKTEAMPAESAGAAATVMTAIHAAPRRLAVPVAVVGLVIATAATGAAASYGTPVYLVVYGAAIAAWFMLVRNAERLPLAAIYGVFALLQCALLFQPASLPTIANGSPISAIAASALKGIALPVAICRVLVIVAMAGAIRLVWDKSRPRRALGIATFPLLLIEGTLQSNLLVLAAALFLMAVIGVQRHREGFAGLAGFIGAGLFMPMFMVLPQLWEEAYSVFPLIVSGLVVIIGTKLILPPGSVWLQPLGAMVTASPILGRAAELLGDLLHGRGVAAMANGLLADTTKRLNISPFAEMTDHGIAIMIVVTVLFLLANFVTRAATIEAMVADGLGITLLLTMSREPAAWAVLVPFAILGNRTFWLLVAVCSPILMLGSPTEPNWVLFGLSVIVPGGWWLALKLQDVAHKSTAETAAAH